MTNRFAPDLDDYPTLKIPDLRKRAQGLLHLMVGADISPEEYLEKLELIETCLSDVYQEAVSLTRIQDESHAQQLQAQLARVTHRPPKSDQNIETLPPDPKVPIIQLDWSKYEKIEDDQND